jgi:hypothetical protein
MSGDGSIDDDPLAGAPDEVLAAFVALGGRAARLRAAKHGAPARSAVQPFADASKLADPAPAQTPVINRKA